MAAVLQVFFYALSHGRVDISFNVIGDFAPHVLTIKYHNQPLASFLPCACNWGARIFCISKRARNSLTFTELVLMPSN